MSEAIAAKAQWIEYIVDVPDHKSGEQVQVQKGGEATVKSLIDAKIVKEIADPTSGASEGLKSLVKEALDGEMKNVIADIRKDYASSSAKAHLKVVGDNEDNDPKFGFKNANEQFRFVKGWYSGDHAAQSDPRMKRLSGLATKAPTTYANEGTGADGGFLLAPEFSTQVAAWAFDDDALFARTDTYTTGSNNLSIPKDETTPWGTSGVQCYWQGEASQVTQSKPKFGQDNLILHKISALVPVSDEQLQDSFVGLGSYVSRQAGQRIKFKVDEAIVNGTGVGQPLGIINSGALVAQAAESGQTAGTVNLPNVLKMISRIPGASIKNLVWLAHPTVFPQLGVLTNGNSSLWVGPGQSESQGPTMGRLIGIPLVLSQHCQAVGTTGDIFLFDLSKYITLSKGDGVQSAMSMHLFFDYNVSSFRFNFRVAGQPWMQAPITSQNGAFKMSPFISLAAR
jgi:HK97 family phage major capsid protein